MGTKSKIRPVVGINSNAWYHVTEGGVDKAGKRFSNMLQVDSSTSGLIVSPNTKPPCYWQFQPFNDTSSSSSSSSSESSSAPRFFVVRNSRDGAAKHLSACRNETEPAPGHTGLCMAAADVADAAQVWQVDQWGDGDMLKDGLRLINVANGTRFLLDAHKGNSPFMNGDAAKDDDDDDDGDGEPSQKWYMTSAQAVNAIEYSTIHIISPSSTYSIEVPTMAADPRAMTGGSSSSSSSSSGGSSISINSDGITINSGGGGGGGGGVGGGGGGGGGGSGGGNGGGLSTGSQVGIGIGVGLAIVALALFAFLWRRRRRSRSSNNDKSGIPPFNANKSLSPVDTESNLSELHCQPPPPATADTDQGHVHHSGMGHHHYYPQELQTPTPASQELPTPTTASQELPTPIPASQELPTPTTTSQELSTPSPASSPLQVAREVQAQQRYELDCTPVSR